jgi:hypothetical protein
MFGSFVAALEHSAFEMSVFQSWPGACTESTTSGSEDSRFKAVAARPPRAPKIGEFFSGVALMANRAIASVERAIENLGKKISAFQYWKASEESMLSVKLAVASRDPGFIKAQFMHLEVCRERQRAFLISQDKSVARRIDERFDSKVSMFIEANRAVLQEHGGMMARQSVCFKSCIPGRAEPERREFHKAHKMINFLLAKSGSHLMREQQQEAKEAKQAEPNS